MGFLNTLAEALRQKRFDGAAYEHELDQKRLSRQYDIIYNLMKDEKWRTLRRIYVITGFPESSISAQLRHMRKPRFGSHTVNRRRNLSAGAGVFEYQLIVNKDTI